jgi:hypothetical protein
MIAEPVGTKIYIGPADSAAATLSAFAALTYTQILGVESVPAVGPTAAVVKFVPLETGIAKKKVGSIDHADPEIVTFADEADLGQHAAILAAIQASPRQMYAFKMVLNDQTTSSYVPTTFYFHAYVTSASIEVGAADNIPRRRFTLAVDGVMIEVPTYLPPASANPTVV